MIQIDYRDARPIYEQLVQGIEHLVLYGALKAESQLPSVRQLALELSINPNTIQRAYGELEARGVIYSVRGRGNFVADDNTAVRTRRLQEISEQLRELAKDARALGVTEAQICQWTAQQEEEHS